MSAVFRATQPSSPPDDEVARLVLMVASPMLVEKLADAAYAKTLDSRIDSAFGSGFATSRADVAAEPIDRNVWKIRLAEVAPIQAYSFLAGNSAIPPAPDAEARMHRQFDEIVRFNQRLIAKSERVREELWKATADREEIRKRLWDDVLGRIYVGAARFFSTP